MTVIRDKSEINDALYSRALTDKHQEMTFSKQFAKYFYTLFCAQERIEIWSAFIKFNIYFKM